MGKISAGYRCAGRGLDADATRPAQTPSACFHDTLPAARPKLASRWTVSRAAQWLRSGCGAPRRIPRRGIAQPIVSPSPTRAPTETHDSAYSRPQHTRAGRHLGRPAGRLRGTCLAAGCAWAACAPGPAQPAARSALRPPPSRVAPAHRDRQTSRSCLPRASGRGASTRREMPAPAAAPVVPRVRLGQGTRTIGQGAWNKAVSGALAHCAWSAATRSYDGS